MKLIKLRDLGRTVTLFPPMPAVSVYQRGKVRQYYPTSRASIKRVERLCDNKGRPVLPGSYVWVFKQPA